MKTPRRVFFLSAFYLFSTNSAVFAETLSQCGTVARAGGEIDGQNHSCGECRENGLNNTGCVKCGSVSVTVPNSYRITDISRSVDDGRYTAWLDEINRSIQGNMTIISTSLKNWQDNSSKQICLRVEVEQ